MRSSAGTRSSARLARSGSTLITAAALFAAATGLAALPPDEARILVGPDVLASRDGEFPHVELMIAANPRNPRNLLGGAITYTKPDGGVACRAYASMDGGSSWHATAFPEQQANGGADPQVAFTPHGTALFAALATVNDEEGRTRAALHVYRSSDGGRQWEGPADLGFSYDHPQIVVDHTKGRFAGRTYISVLYGREYNLGVFRSDDDGRSFIGPVKFVDGGGGGVNVTPPLVLSDGTLVVTYADFPIDPEKRKTVRESGLWLVSSEDGGLTFSQPRKILSQSRPSSLEGPATGLMTFPAFALDTSTRYRDRIYAAWSDFSSDQGRILFSSSSDRGRTWTPPAPVDASVPDRTHQYQPSLAVNNDGTVGVTWFDTRGVQGRGYNLYFSASVDGGATFLAAKRISSVPSRVDGAGNLRVSTSGWRDPSGALRIPFLSAASRWGQGGDYMGLTADARGVFHPFWADSRTGTFQAWTARISVERGGPPAASPAPPTAKAPAPLREAVVTDRIEIVMDPSQYDPATRELLLAIRLRNVSSSAIHQPIRVEVKTFGSGRGTEWRDNMPAILNSSNGNEGDGAVMDYSKALGSLDRLEPGAQTAAVVWRLRMKEPNRVPDMHIVVHGRVPDKP